MAGSASRSTLRSRSVAAASHGGAGGPPRGGGGGGPRPQRGGGRGGGPPGAPPLAGGEALDARVAAELVAGLVLDRPRGGRRAVPVEERAVVAAAEEAD